MDDDQVEDRIDEAVLMFQTFHMDGSQQMYTSHKVTANDVTNHYVQMDANTIGVTRIFTLTGSSTNSEGNGGFNMFDINYQIRLNELYDYTAGDYVYFEIANQHLRMLEMLFTGEIPIRYNKYTNLLYIDAIWESRFPINSYFIIEVFTKLPPTGTQYGDPWLMDFTYALLKRQWGENLKKFNSIALPGGMVLNGQQIWSEADAECQRLEKKVREEYEIPAQMLFG
ncbi:MAG: hypothetical protein ACREQ5_08655 [Candidatus Dormibacteria bacterium]